MKLLLLSFLFLGLTACSHYRHHRGGGCPAGSKECGKGGKSGCKGKYGNRHGMKKLDTDKDGMISKAEFDAKFTAMDSNKDGKVSEAEMKAFKKAKCGDKKKCTECKGK